MKICQDLSVVHGGLTDNSHKLTIREIPTGYKEKCLFPVPSSVAGYPQRACAFFITEDFQHLAR